MEILWFLKGTKKISKDKSRKSGHQKPGLGINMAFTEMIYLNCFLRNVEKNFRYPSILKNYSIDFRLN